VAVVGAHLRNGPLTGLALVQHLRTQGLHTRSVILLDQAEKNLVLDAFRAGAKGLFSRIVVVPYAMSDANSNNSRGKGAVVRLRNGTFTTIA
jgi:DNA-binding NarL/FixJ family response regulator